ncbi:Rv3235 family protein [Streptomyces sp. Marseille-Q5077]|uniref:Rv3235 family protein n=1 Tax=Streptomyces sp. Marseille-Q5077 TaxID=3418995 RepID=UPI003D083326
MLPTPAAPYKITNHEVTDRYQTGFTERGLHEQGHDQGTAPPRHPPADPPRHPPPRRQPAPHAEQRHGPYGIPRRPPTGLLRLHGNPPAHQAHGHPPSDCPRPYAAHLAPPGGRNQPLDRPAVPQPRPTDVFADRLLLVLSGQRPVHWMLRHTAGRAYDELAWLAERGLLRTRGTRPVVRDIGYFEPRPGAIEAFARIGAGDQLRAMAFRLEQGGDLRWRCTAVELGGPRRPRPDDD